MLTENRVSTGQPPAIREMNNGNEIKGPQNGPPTGPKKTSIAIWVVIAILVVVAGLAFWGVHRRSAAAAAAAARSKQIPAVPVLAGTVEQKDVPIYLDGLGTVQAFNTVTVRVQVDGKLKKVAFTEGQDVKAGDLLAQVDPDPYQAALDEAKAKKGQDEAQLINAQIGLKRETDLLAAKIDAQQVYDTQKALTDQLDATVKADEAAIEASQINLTWTAVVSPIDGRTGIRQVDQGNIVHATDTNGLVVITQLKPISVMFTLPEQNLEDIHKAMAPNGELKVLAVGRDDSEILDEGKLAVIDNQIDITTGTIRLKATFPNEQLRLWPGQFVNVRMLLNVVKNGLTVPAAAIQRGPNGAYVFVIQKGTGMKPGGGGGRKGSGSGKDVSSKNQASTNDASSAETAKGNENDSATKVAENDPPPQGGTNSAKGGAGGSGNAQGLIAKMQTVTVSDQVSGPEALVTTGLQKGERIVVDGQNKLQDGSPIRVAQQGKTGPAAPAQTNSMP
jgi:multidrug efflux system membrane fusion protein